MLNGKLKIGQYMQQGDVIVEVVEKVKGKKLNHLTLAKGEVTGHHHTITKGNAELYEENGILYLKVLDEAELTHQEHGVITLPKNDYIVRKVREYSHFDEETKNVQD